MEDSNAGFEFFSNVWSGEAHCISARGKSNIFKLLQKFRQNKILVIADGAAFGCEMEKVIRKRRKTPVFRHGDIRRVHLICVSN